MGAAIKATYDTLSSFRRFVVGIHARLRRPIRRQAMPTNQPDGLDEFAIRLIKRKARHLIGTASFTRSDVEDIMSELTLDLLERLPQFDPNKAQRHTFIVRVVEHKIFNIVRHRTQEMRDQRREACSLNEQVHDGEGCTVERAATVSEEDHDRRWGIRDAAEGAEVDVRLDIAEAVARLPKDLGRVYELLKNQSIAEAARQLGIPRTTLIHHVQKLCDFFSKAGLEVYLPASCSSSAESAG